MPIFPGSLLRWTTKELAAAERRNVLLDPRTGAYLAPDTREGVIVGPPAPTAQPFLEAIASWQAVAPAGTQIEIGLRAEIDGRWTRWWMMGLWSSEAERRCSVPDQSDDDGAVATDTLVLRRPAQTVQWRVVLRSEQIGETPLLHGVGVTTSLLEVERPADSGRPVPPLAVPEISQMEAGEQGWQLCSAAALTMILAYWYQQTHDPRLGPFTAPDATERLTAPAIYDRAYDGTGNWTFNTAFATSVGLEAYVARFTSPAELENWVAAGVPIVASLAWEASALDGAPIVRSAGHLIVVVGFTPDGDVIVNDPRHDTRAGARVRAVYRREQFTRAWQTKSRGTVYLIFPDGWPGTRDSPDQIGE